MFFTPLLPLLHAMRVQVVDKNGRELPEEALRAIGLGNMLREIERLWPQDVGGAIAALREGKARCEWDGEGQKWVCVSSGARLRPGFEAVIRREEDEWVVVVRLYEEWDGVWFRAAAALVESFEEFENRLRRLEEEVYKLAKAVERATKKEEEEEWEEDEEEW